MKLHPSLALVVSAVLRAAWHIYDAEAKPTNQQGQPPTACPSGASQPPSLTRTARSRSCT